MGEFILIDTDVLKVCVRYVIALWPKCVKYLMLMSSGPVEWLFLALCFFVSFHVP